MARRKRGARAAPPDPRPLWADPAVAVATSAFRFTDYALAGTVARRVAVPDPTRIAIGFVWQPSDTAAALVGPYPDAADVPWATLQEGAVYWYKLFDFGSVVCLDWWAYSEEAGSVRVVESYMLEQGV